jgi:hypothetical protein
MGSFEILAVSTDHHYVHGPLIFYLLFFLLTVVP